MTGNPPLIVILGPTAIGKTSLALQIAAQHPVEIISADSRQIYQYMDIGTAKPTPTEQAQAPHHLIDVVTPDENLSLAQYQRLAYAHIEDIHARGKIPMLVGGTGQYITAILEGWSIPEIPPNEALRQELEAFAQIHGTAALYQRLQTLDPEAAEKIHPNNVRRVVRALEVCLQSGTPMSVLQRKRPPHYSVRQYGLTLERDALYQRADQRLDEMVQQGFVEEVAMLLNKGYTATLPAMSGIGYQQIAAHLAGSMSLEQALQETKYLTHDFIRRQITWFRGHDGGISWHNSNAHEFANILTDVSRWRERHAL